MPIVIVRNFETVYFCDDGYDWKISHVRHHVSLTFSGLKKKKKLNHGEFLQNKYFDGVHKSIVLCIHTAF